MVNNMPIIETSEFSNLKQKQQMTSRPTRGFARGKLIRSKSVARMGCDVSGKYLINER